MKFTREITKYVLLLLIISASFIVSKPIKEKKKGKAPKGRSEAESKTQYNGGGSYTATLECPFIETALTGGKSTTSGKYSFRPMDLTSRTGFAFNMEATDENVSKFVQVDNAITYIPWRYFKKIEGNKKWGSYKYIEADLVNDFGQEATFKFNLPWRCCSNIVTNAQRNALVEKMAKFRDDEKADINKFKDNATSYFLEMQKSNIAMEASKKDAATFKAETEERIKKNQAALTIKQAELAEIEGLIAKNRDSTNTLILNLKEFKTQLSALQKKSESNDEIIDETLRAGAFKGIDEKITKAQQDIKLYNNQFSALCANANLVPVQGAIAEVDSVKLNAAFSKIQPISE